MPADLRQHVRYPEGIFNLQAAMYSTYHMTNPAVFYNKEDQWEVPAIDRGTGEAVRMEPYYTIMRLPGETSAEFIQMLPFTPRRSDNLAAWMVARSDGDRYGQLLVFQFPEAEARVRPETGRRPDQSGSGDLAADHAVEPAGLAGHLGHADGDPDRGVADLRPAALSARAEGRIPELTRVIVAYQNQIVMEPTLEAGLNRLFGAAGRKTGRGEARGARRRGTAATGGCSAVNGYDRVRRRPAVRRSPSGD